MKYNNKNKRRGPFGAIIIFVVIILILSLFMSFSFAPRVKAKNLKYEYVMKDVFSDRDPLVTKIAMLGAHDAFSSGITFTSFSNSNESGIVVNKAIGTLAKGLVVRLSKAQNASAKELLYAGVRYLDVRVTKINNVYYGVHAYVSNKLETYLKDVVDYLNDHNGELIIFDIQAFYTENGFNTELSKDEYLELFDEIDRVKNDEGKSLLDYVFYNTNTDPLSTLRYVKATNNRENSGVIILAKCDGLEKAYYRDKDASYKRTMYESIRSLWHESNSSKEMMEGIREEYDYLKTHDYSDVFVVNQAQKTGFLANASIIRSLFGWSLLDMANNFNRTLVKDEDEFKEWLSVMPIFMVDNATSMKGKFNAKANEYIKEYNEGL